MSSNIRALLILAVLVVAPVGAQEAAYEIDVAVACRTASGGEVFATRATLQVVAGRPVKWVRAMKVPVEVETAQGIERRFEEVGTRIEVLGRPAGEGALDIDLGLATTRQMEGDRILSVDLQIVGRVGLDGEAVEMARVESTGPEGETWSVQVAARPVGRAVARRPDPPPGGREVRLQGVVVEGEGPARAILSIGGRVLEVEVGDLVPGDWQVLSIDSDGVVLRGPGGVRKTLVVE